MLPCHLRWPVCAGYIQVFWTTYISWSAGSSGRPEVEAVI